MYVSHYEGIKQLLKERSTIVQAPVNRRLTIDWFRNQYSKYDQVRQGLFPFVYIQFLQPMVWQLQTDDSKRAEATIRLHIVDFDVKDDPTTFLCFCEYINNLAEGQVICFENEIISDALHTPKTNFIEDYDQIKVMQIDYSTTLYKCDETDLVSALISHNLGIEEG